MFVRATQVLGLTLALAGLTACSSFAMSYQNYFTKNFAYFASKYDGNPQAGLSSGAESNNFEDGNEASYSAGEVPQLITGFRSLEFHNTNYSTGAFDIAFGAFMVPPGKSEGEALPVANFALKGTSFTSAKTLPEATNIVLIKMSYPAPMIYLDSKALIAKYGSGTYTMIWKASREDGKDSNRELSRVSTNLVP